MADYTVSCDAIALGEAGVIVTLAVYTDGEGFNSYVCEESDVSSANAPNVRTDLLDIQVWLMSLWRSESGIVFVSDEHGNVHRYDGTSWTATAVSSNAITCLWGFSENSLYAVGDEGVVYRWDGAAWTSISPPLGDTIFSIRGLSPDDLYVCGAEGLFYHFHHSIWTRIELPTNQRLLGLLARNHTDILVCGAGGTLYRGADLTWTDVSQPGHDFHALAEYRGTIFLAGGGEGVFEFDGVAVTNIKDTIISYRLTSNADYLASAGDTIAARFDGSQWFGAEYS